MLCCCELWIERLAFVNLMCVNMGSVYTASQKLFVHMISFTAHAALASPFAVDLRHANFERLAHH